MYHNSPLEGGRLDHKYKNLYSSMTHSLLCFENKVMIPVIFQLHVLVVVRKWNHSTVIFTCHTRCVPHRSGLSLLLRPSSTRRQMPVVAYKVHARPCRSVKSSHTPAYRVDAHRAGSFATIKSRIPTNLNWIAHKNANEKFVCSSRYIWCRRNFGNVVNLSWVNLDFCR